MDQWDYKEDLMLQEDSRSMEDERDASEVPPPNGRIRVKLKFPRMVPEEEEEEEEGEAEAEIGLGEEIKTHCCKVCNRSLAPGRRWEVI
ncbi:UNVERIFIED_CONTAM: hypothetical protein Sangu_0347400 [Sesamum angustifolium]|uniref:Uncharacterized protein n=1 Tax=Sesamum angustifolium TaxID=2727405 RepID=A0AAW2QRQ7_9LAMI